LYTGLGIILPDLKEKYHVNYKISMFLKQILGFVIGVFIMYLIAINE